jgi:peptide/nickel transport system substrate-binding protein
MRFIPLPLQGLMCGLALLLAGCNSAGPERDPARVTMAVAREINTLDPAATFVISNQLAINLAYEKLVVAELVDGRPTGQVIGQLAERWEVSPDGLQWTFFLRPGHHFDDGAEVTAEAVKFSFERTIKLKAPPAQFLFFLRGVEVINPYEVRFTLRTPVAFFLQVLAVPTASIVNPAVAMKIEGDELGRRWLTTNTAGSGPYRVERFVRGQQVLMRENPNAQRKPDYFREVNFIVVKDDATRAIQLSKGALDIVDPVPGTVDDWVRGKAGVKVESGPSPIIAFLHMNNERPLFKDSRVRHAVSLAIDRDKIGQAIYDGRARLVRGVLPEGIPGHDSSLPHPRHDPDEARRLLAEAGVKAGTRITFTVVGDGNSPSPVAVAIQHQLRAIGFDVVIERISTAARTKIMKGDFDITMQSINLDFPDPSIVFNFVYNSAMIGGANFPRYRNPEVDQLIARADRSLDLEQRAALYRQAQRIVVEQMPTAVLYQLDWQRAQRADVQGVQYNFAQPSFYNFESMSRVTQN